MKAGSADAGENSRAGKESVSWAPIIKKLRACRTKTWVREEGRACDLSSRMLVAVNGGKEEREEIIVSKLR